MAEFAVHVTTDVTDLSDDQLDELVEQFADHSGVPSMLGGRLSVQMTVDDAENLGDAALIATTAVQLRLPVPGRAVAVEVMTAEDFARGFGEAIRAEDLVPTAEAAEILGVKRQRVLQLAKAYAGQFPEPVRLGSRGLYWSRAALSRFAATRDRTSGPKKGKPRTTA